MKLSSLSRTSLLLFICFGVDKVAAIVRQLLVARQFGLSAELDVFNIANNLPDMLFTLISGGALSMALIPVMADVLNKKGNRAAWKLFSSIANLTFLIALFIAIICAIMAKPIVTSNIGIAPGFNTDQQHLVVELMRLNLVAMMIFSISGLVMGGLQANQRFLAPALAPIFYNCGQILGAVVLSPDTPYRFAGIQIPCFGQGVYGLVGGVLLGALLHLFVQIPALLCCNFHWQPGFCFGDRDVRHVLRILGPRILSVFFVQLIFIVRDNLASRLAVGSVTALSYGYMFQQLPETLVGTALGTAILPSLSLFISQDDSLSFSKTVNQACSLALAFSIGAATIMAVGFGPLIGFALGFDDAQNLLMIWTMRGFLVGLTGHCLLEVANRAFFAQQEALIPLLGTILNLFVYILIGNLLYQRLDAPGISLTDSIAFTLQATFVLITLRISPLIRHKVVASENGFLRWLSEDQDRTCEQVSVSFQLSATIIRSLVGATLAAAVCLFIMRTGSGNLDNLVKSMIGMVLALCVYLPFIYPEIKTFRSF